MWARFFCVVLVSVSVAADVTTESCLDTQYIEDNVFLWKSLFTRLNTIVSETSGLSESQKGLTYTLLELKERQEKQETKLSKFIEETKKYFSNLERRQEKRETQLSEFIEENKKMFSILVLRQERQDITLSRIVEKVEPFFSNLAKSLKSLSDATNSTQNDLMAMKTELQQQQNNLSHFMEHYLDSNAEWTTVLRRQNGSVNFRRTFTEYQNGFGNPAGEFFIGLEKLHKLTTLGEPQELLIVIKDFDNIKKNARYDKFKIGNTMERYEVLELGTYSGTAGDSLATHKHMKFTSFYNDNDDIEMWDCATTFFFSPIVIKRVAFIDWSAKLEGLQLAEMKIRSIEKRLGQEQQTLSHLMDQYLANNEEWTTVLRRQDGSVNFYRNWTEYQNGFGNKDGEFFIGLEKLHNLTTLGAPQELLIVLKDFENEKRIARYDKFKIGNAEEEYQLLEVGTYSGDAGDSFCNHKDMKFSTHDNDNDDRPDYNCAEGFEGAWWFNKCYHSHLFGQYGKHDGIDWNSWRDSGLKFAEMKIRSKFN